RLGKVNVAAISSLSKYADKRGVLLIPSSLYDETVPGRQPVFTPDEQDAVIAHELAHIRHNDSLRITGHNMAKSVTMISYIFAGIGMFLGAVPMGAFLGCAALYSGATWLQQFCSRQVEYRTDSTAIAFTENPAALASALEKI
ncbi:MAG: M48 family metalloprotease, partial [Alphaproteobacteria bacterium]|nr:M48 family metalloprotease [Alphaproteobacteria bacterium]